MYICKGPLIDFSLDGCGSCEEVYNSPPGTHVHELLQLITLYIDLTSILSFAVLGEQKTFFFFFVVPRGGVWLKSFPASEKSFLDPSGSLVRLSSIRFYRAQFISWCRQYKTQVICQHLYVILFGCLLYYIFFLLPHKIYFLKEAFCVLVLQNNKIKGSKDVSRILNFHLFIVFFLFFFLFKC